MEIFRTTSKLELKQWAGKRRVFIELSPAIPGVKGQPQAGEQRFDYTKKVRISFRTVEMFTAAYKFLGLAHGAELELKKFADMSKSVGTGDDKKQLLVNKYNDKISVSIKSGDNKVSINIEPEESYAIGKWFEAQATRFALLESDEEDGKASDAVKASE